MRHAARKDANHNAIAAALRQIGCSVHELHAAGDGVSDLLVGYRGRNVLIEVKDGDKPPSARRLTPAQMIFRAEWRGQYDVAETVDQAIAIVQRVTLGRHVPGSPAQGGIR
jgi:hypothetical protein